MTLSLEIARQDIRDHLTTFFTQVAIEDAVPEAEQLARFNGMVVPYIVYNFGDIAVSANTSVVGPRNDGYVQAVNFYAIGPDRTSASQLYMKILDKFLGFEPSYGGMMRKRPGGGTFGVYASNGAVEAYINPVSFIFSTEILTV